MVYTTEMSRLVQDDHCETETGSEMDPDAVVIPTKHLFGAL